VCQTTGACILHPHQLVPSQMQGGETGPQLAVHSPPQELMLQPVSVDEAGNPYPFNGITEYQVKCFVLPMRTDCCCTLQPSTAESVCSLCVCSIVWFIVKYPRSCGNSSALTYLHHRMSTLTRRGTQSCPP
jgi:hypothetical protein